MVFGTKLGLKSKLSSEGTEPIGSSFPLFFSLGLQIQIVDEDIVGGVAEEEDENGERERSEIVSRRCNGI